MSARCTYDGWYAAEPREPVLMDRTGTPGRLDADGRRLAEYRCTEPALVDGRCSVHLDVGNGPRPLCRHTPPVRRAGPS